MGVSRKDNKSMSDDVNTRQYSVQALVILAELIASLLDVIYSSEEKEKVVPFLHTIMPNVFPYLRNHRYIFFFQILYQSCPLGRDVPA